MKAGQNISEINWQIDTFKKSPNMKVSYFVPLQLSVIVQYGERFY